MEKRIIISNILLWSGWILLLGWYISIWEARMLITLPIMIFILISIPIKFYKTKEKKQKEISHKN